MDRGVVVVVVFVLTTAVTCLDAGVCEINTHVDGAGVFNVPTPLPLFQ